MHSFNHFPNSVTSTHTVGVSAVIPTHKRPDLVVVSVESALRQTYTDLEVIVVIDGADPATESALAEIRDDRLRIVSVPVNVGAATARNIGIRTARGKWIAFLDDDDEWLPAKIAKQVAMAESSALRFPIVSC